jgi:peptidoglycan/LPS O-acetylase OafA/YrhL
MDKPPYRPEIDGLRALAVLAVMVFHLDKNWLPGGFAGVDVFFVISGYLVASIILRDQAAGTFHLGRFYQRRIACILPAFLVAAGATLLAARFLYSIWDLAAAGASFGASVLSIANIHLLGLGDYFQLSADAQPLLHCWSLSVEEQFYLLFPAGMLAIGRLGFGKRLFALAGLTLLSFACGLWLTSSRAPWAFYLLPPRAWELLAGALLALIESRRGPVPARSWNPAGSLGLVLVLTSFAGLHESRPFPGWLALWPVAGAVLIVRSGWSRPVLGWKPLAALGRVSYSLYLWHWPVFSMVDYSLLHASPGQRLIWKTALTLILSLTSYHLIEQPCRHWFNRPRRPGPAFALLASSLLLLAPLGYHIRYSHYLDGSDGTAGQLTLGHARSPHTLMLVGDSQGTMYANLLRGIALEKQARLLVLCIAGDDPLTVSSGPPGPLWLSCLARIKQEKPACVVLVCDWIWKLAGDPARLQKSLEEIAPHTSRILLLTMPPRLPAAASRAAIRQGSRPPFPEDDAAPSHACNDIVRRCAGGKVRLVEIDPLFTSETGGILCYDEAGQGLFNDTYHLSGKGAARVRPLIEANLADWPLTAPQTP